MSKRVRFSTEDNKVHVLPDTQRTSTREQDEQVEQLAGDYKRLKTDGSDHALDMDADAVEAAKMSRRRRADKGEEDTEEVDILAAEEEAPEFADDEEETEVPLEPFNMRQEREEGIADESGNLLERKKERKKPVGGFNDKGDYVIMNDEEEEEADGWLDSLSDVKVDRALASKLAAKAAANDTAAYEDDVLDDDDKVVFKKRVASLLKPRETVLGALRRLGGTQQQRGRETRNTKRKNRHKKDGASADDLQPSTSGGGQSSVSAEDKAAFNKLTELADALLSNGEFNIYSFTREGLLESVGVSTTWGQEDAPATPVEPPPSAPQDAAKQSIADIFAGAPISVGAAGAAPQQPGAAAAADDDDMDMFGSDEEGASKKPAAAQASSSGTQETAKAATSEPSSTSSAATTAGGGGGAGAMEGFQYDEGSGYYYNSESGYWYDSSTGLYGNAATGLWYSYSDGQYHLVDNSAEAAAA